MDESGIIRLLLAELPELQAAYVFGSEARGDSTPQSDIDLAILVPVALEAVARWELQEKLANLLRRDVDLVDLRTASAVMRASVLSDSRLLFDGASTDRQLFEALALSDYARLNEERREILEQVRREGRVYA